MGFHICFDKLLCDRERTVTKMNCPQKVLIALQEATATSQLWLPTEYLLWGTDHGKLFIIVLNCLVSLDTLIVMG